MMRPPSAPDARPSAHSRSWRNASNGPLEARELLVDDAGVEFREDRRRRFDAGTGCDRLGAPGRLIAVPAGDDRVRRAAVEVVHLADLGYGQERAAAAQRGVDLAPS